MPIFGAANQHRPCLLVLGMHRSGTSALAGCLALAGGTVPRTQIEPCPTNAKGFFESLLICEINDLLFRSLHSDWSYVKPLDWNLLSVDVAEELQQRVMAVLVQVFDDASLLVFKDHRLCRLLPFWEPVLSRFCSFVLPVIIYRDPSEVALSLQANYPLEDWHCHLLWLWYVLESESRTRDMKRVVVAFDDLLADGMSVIVKIAAASPADCLLRGDDLLSCGPGASAKPLSERIGSFLSLDLRHHVVDHRCETADSPLLALVQKTFRIVTDLANGQPSIQHQWRLDAVLAELDQASALFPSLISSSTLGITKQLGTLGQRDAGWLFQRRVEFGLLSQVRIWQSGCGFH